MTDKQWERLTWFSADEKDHNGNPAFPKPEKMSFVLMKKLDRARALAQVTFTINSSWRENDKKTHGSGEAVDIRCVSSGKRHKMLNAFTAVGFVRRGIYDKHIHVDIGKASDGHAQNVLWWGKSK